MVNPVNRIVTGLRFCRSQDKDGDDERRHLPTGRLGLHPGRESVENRYRFAHEIIQAVRQVVPPERLLTFRISNWGVADMEISLFEDKAEWQQIIKMLSNEPIDAISVSTYDYSAKAFGTDQTMARITREATDLPLMICGKIYDRATAEDALKDADIILSAKSILLNPNWVDDIRRSKDLPLYKSEDANVAYTDEPLP